MAFSQFTITSSYGTATFEYDLKEIAQMQFRLRTAISSSASTMSFDPTSGSGISVVGTAFDVTGCIIDIIFPSAFNNATYNGYLFYGTINAQTVNTPVTYNSARQSMALGSSPYSNNPHIYCIQKQYINGVKVEKAYTNILSDSIQDNYLAVGQQTVLIQGNNYFENAPIAVYNGNTYTFTLSPDRATATLSVTISALSQMAISATAKKVVPISYDFDANVDFYLTDLNGNVIAVNPDYFDSNSYLYGYLVCKNDATFTDVNCRVDGTRINGSYNTEHTRFDFVNTYITGSETAVTMYARSEVVSGAAVVQNLTNCTSSVSTPKLALGSHTITLTANVDTIFNVAPTANYNNVDYQFTLNNDSTVATLDITLDVADITLTITGVASISSLQGISNFYKPTLEELQYISNHRYKWQSGEYSSERLDLGEYILNLKTVFAPLTVRATEKVVLGGNELDLYIHPLDATYIDLETPNQLIRGYYGNDFDNRNITAFYATIPFYGIYELNREYINKNIRFKFHIDLSNCDVEISVFVGNKLVETLTGDCSIDIPYIMEKSLTPKTECFTGHLKIVVNEKTNCNNRVRTIKNDVLSNFTGFVKGDVITDSIKATSQELELIKKLFNEGVYNGHYNG